VKLSAKLYVINITMLVACNCYRCASGILYDFFIIIGKGKKYALKKCGLKFGDFWRC
jgi:hypothetical protein